MALQPFACRALVVSSVVVWALSASAQVPSTQDLVGTWNLTLTSPQGRHPTTVTIKDAAGQLEGSVSGERGTTPLAIETSEAGVKLSFKVDYQGQPLPIVMTGRVADGTLKGLVDYGNGSASGDFEGRKGTAASNGGASAAGSAAGVAGTWLISSDGGSGWSFELTQEGTAVAGTLRNADQGLTLPVKGTIDGGALTLAVTSPDASGTVKGTLQDGALKGTYELNGDSGAWSATRKP